VTRGHKKKRSARIDDVTWQLFVRACGGRCCKCSADTKLEQGHIQRHADDGKLRYENLIPLCKSCNGKHSRGFTRDSRPAGWLDAFLKLMLAENGVALRWQRPKQGGNTRPAGQDVESTGFVDLGSVEFVANSSYTTPTADPPSTRPMDATAARRLMWDLFERSRSCAFPPKRPLAKRQDQMMAFAMRHGRDVFQMAGAEFLREEPCPWLAGDVERGGYAMADSWAHLCESFDGYVIDGQARRLRDAKRAEQKKLDDAKQAAANIVSVREQRWRDYMMAACAVEWPEMTAEDKTFLAELVAEKTAGEVKDVSDDRLATSLSIFRRWRFYKQDELRDAKQKHYDKLAQCVVWAKAYDDVERQKELGDEIMRLRNWIDGLKTIEELNEHGWAVDALHTDLDPNTPSVQQAALEDLFGEEPF
jgi:HNH endonuclease